MASEIFEILNSHSYLIFRAKSNDWNAPDWIFSEIIFKAGIFSGSFSAEFNLADFIILRSKLAKFYNDPEGEFIFQDSDKNCQLQVSGNGAGDFACNVIINDMKESNAVLHYQLEFDRTQIDGMIIQLDSIINAYS